MKILYPDSNADAHSLRRSYWMIDAETTIPTEPPLTEDIDVDVAIIGGGFVGLWTAIFAKQKKPETRVAVFERDMCGGGASGRNGGLVMSWWSELEALIALFGEAEAFKLAKISETAIQELADFCTTHYIDAHFQKGGWLWTATTEAHVGDWDKTLAAANRSGCSPYQRLTPEAVAQMSGSDRHLGGVIDPTNATVQPALLVAGIKRVALEMGIEIYEKTPVTELSYDVPAKLITPYADVTAKKVVLATNVWVAAIPELEKYIMPVSSSLIVTEPMPEQLAAMGLKHGLGITDSYQIISYYRSTMDGRIVYGDSFAGLSHGGKITDLFSQHDKGTEFAIEDFLYTYPMLEDVEITDSWSGPVDYSNEHFPIFGHLQDAPHVFYGVGWSGNGVSPSQIGGKILSSLALEIDDEWANSVLVGTVERGLNRPFPPRSLRFYGGSLVRSAILWREEFEFANRKPPKWLEWVTRLGGDIGT